MCCALSRCTKAHSDHLLFSSLNVMMIFTQHAIALSKLTTQMSLMKRYQTIKNRKTRLHRFVTIIRLIEIWHVQQCVQWVLKHKIDLIIIDENHSDHCLWLNVVSINMSVFDQVNILTTRKNEEDFDFDFNFLIIVEIDCKTRNIVRKIMMTSVTVFLRARSSVDARLWLQDNIEHLTKLHELACNVIVDVVVISVDSDQILCIDRVSSSHRSINVVRLKNESSLLWAMKDVEINFDIVISVTFKTYATSIYLTWNWVISLSDNLETRLRLSDFDKLVVRKLLQNCFADTYLY